MYVQRLFSDRNGIMLEISSKILIKKSLNIWKLIPKRLLVQRVNNPQFKREVKMEIRKYLELSENENTTYQNCGMQLKQC